MPGTWDGYTGHDDGKPLDAEFARLFPPGPAAAAPGHQAQESRTVAYPGEGQGKRKRKPKPAAS
jgi:hypothetical protein